VHTVDETTDYRIAITVKSQLSPSELEYLIDDRLTPDQHKHDEQGKADAPHNDVSFVLLSSRVSNVSPR
jgi:hypothetical protein